MGVLYDRYGKLAFAVIVRIVPDKGAAEDLMAETFVTAWNQIGRWKDARSEDLALWILVLARNHATEHLRSTGAAVPPRLPKLTVFEQPALLLDSSRPRNAEQSRAWRKAIESLDANERQALELASFHGLNAAEIANRMDQPLAAAREMLAAALDKLGGRI